MRYAILIVLFGWWAQPAASQSPEEFFHDGARIFVDGNLNEALSVVEAGLETTPGHPKLEALKQLIEEEKEQQSGSEGSQDQDEKNQEEQQDQSEDNDSQQGNQNDDSQQEGDQQQEQSGEEGTPPPPESNQPEQEQQSDSHERQSSAAGENSEELSRAQALRILQALQNEEEQLLREVQKVKGKARRVEKDW